MFLVFAYADWPSLRDVPWEDSDQAAEEDAKPCVRHSWEGWADLPPTDDEDEAEIMSFRQCSRCGDTQVIDDDGRLVDL